MTFKDLWAKIPSIVHTIVIAVVMGTVLYGVGYCNGNSHGSASERAKMLEQRNDSLVQSIKKISEEGVEAKKRFDLTLSEALKNAQKSKEKAENVIVKGPGKIQLITINGPKVVPIPVEVTDRLVQDSITISMLNDAIVQAEKYINTLQAQVVAEHLRAENNYQLYLQQKKVKQGHGFVAFMFGLALGAITVAFAK
jgi:hypothetical protein